MSRIVAIGGGEIAREETEPIDQYICDLAGSATPQVLFVPTASGDASEYCDTFDSYYGDTLGCETRQLLLHGDGVEREEIRTNIDWADVVYVGGGSVPLLLDCWQTHGVDQLLYEAYQEGTVMTGLSAGAMCWFTRALSDSVAGTEFTMIDCLGWIDHLACTPHAGAGRRPPFRDELEAESMSGIALEDCCAIEIRDGQYRILSATGEETAYSYTHRDGSVECSALPEGEFDDLSALL